MGKIPIYKAINVVDSILDIARETLDPTLFILDGEQPILQPEVRKQILQLVSSYSQWGKVSKVILIGSALTKQYASESDLDVTLIIEPFSEEAYSTARITAGESWDKDFVVGTEHPINIFVRDDYDPSTADQIYDVLSNKWIKQTAVEPIDIDAYMDMFRRYVREIDLTAAELKRDIVDFNKLREFDIDQLNGLKKKAEGKIAEINQDVQRLSAFYKVAHALRKAAFKQELSPEEIKQYQVKNLLPANILYKLLERYQYTRLLSELVKILNDAGGSIDTPDEVDDVEKALKQSESIDPLIDELIGSCSGGSVTLDTRSLSSASVSLTSLINELTTGAAAGSYDVPLGATPQGRKKRRRDKRKDLGIA